MLAILVLLGLTRLLTETCEDQLDGVRFIEKRGFRQMMRYPLSEIDTATFDPARFAGRVEHTVADGIKTENGGNYVTSHKW